MIADKNRAAITFAINHPVLKTPSKNAPPSDQPKTTVRTMVDIAPIERKMTLPLIYCINQCDKKEKKVIINTVKNHNEDPQRVRQIIKMVEEKGGIDYAANKMKEYKDEALEILLSFDQLE